MTLTYRLGKTAARPGAYSFHLGDYLTTPLPAAPAVFGHQTAVPGWGMLGNDRYGDCVWAGAAHETMTWAREASTAVAFSTTSVLSDYSAATGFKPSDPNTDQGTDMQAAASYRRKTGVIDADSKRHTVDAYLALPGVNAHGRNSATMLPALASAAYVFGGIGIGIEFPNTAMTQFNQGQPWSVVDGATIEGGHYIPLLGRNTAGNYIVVTWGRTQEVTPDFLQTYVDEAIVYFSIERLTNNASLDGFNLDALRADLAALGGTPAPAPTPGPTPAPTNTWPAAAVDPWLNSRVLTAKGKAAQAALKTYEAALKGNA